MFKENIDTSFEREKNLESAEIKDIYSENSTLLY